MVIKKIVTLLIFKISNVDGTNLDLFKSFLNLLPVNNPLSTNINLHSEVYSLIEQKLYILSFIFMPFSTKRIKSY